MYYQSLELIGYTNILDQLKDFALTNDAKTRIKELKPLLSELSLRKQLSETTQARKMLDLLGAPPLSAMEHIGSYIEKSIRGELLLPEHFEEIGLFLNSVNRLISYLKKGEEHQLNIAFYSENLSYEMCLKEEIDRCIRAGKVDDYASTYLFDLRKQTQLISEKITQKAERALNAYKSYTSDSFVVTRNGHLCIPVRKECRSKVEGAVIDKSSSGFTVFVEPASISEIREELEFYKIEADSEERRILYTLTNMIAEKEAALKEDIRVIAALDYIFAKGKLSLDMDGIEPKINLDRRIRLSKARHPMLRKETCVPLDFEIGNGINGIIITGPNTGGKTVALKTVALMCAMACSGFHVPCQEADITMNSQIFCDIGDGQDISDNLSTFSAHIKNVLEILKRVTPDCLVIMDELGSGTDPSEGMGIAVSILEQLRKSNSLFLATTHYPEIKEYAERHSDVRNARMDFDKESLKPLYRMSIGKSGESCALYIAKCLGYPKDMLLTAAHETYGSKAENLTQQFDFTKENLTIGKIKIPGLQKISEKSLFPDSPIAFTRGDSVEILPECSIGIVVNPADPKGNVLVQIKKEKVVINQKRLKLKVAASQLYPEDYDFSIIFDSVENRKARHQMTKHHQDGLIIDI